MAVADTKVPIQRTFLAFSDQNKISRKNLEAGQHPTTRHWFLLHYFLKIKSAQVKAITICLREKHSFRNPYIEYNMSNIFSKIGNIWCDCLLFKVGNKDTETISVSLMWTFNSVYLIYSSHNLLLKLHYYILPLTITSFILQVFLIQIYYAAELSVFLFVIWLHHW